jgi:uncharacterized protein
MTRLLFWLVLAFLVLAALRSKFRAVAPPRPPQPAPRDPAAKAKAAAGEVETMLCCAHCQIYYPASETVTVDGRDYCCAAHASAS